MPEKLALTDCKTHQDYADYYAVSLSTISRLAKIGADLTNENEVLYLQGKKNLPDALKEYRASLSPRSDTQTPPVGEYSLKDSLQALRQAEALLAGQFAQSPPAARSRALKDWLDAQSARMELEKQIFEVEKLNSETLPIDEVTATWTKALTRYREELEAIPAKWSCLLYEKPQWEVQEVLKGLVQNLVCRHLEARE